MWQDTAWVVPDSHTLAPDRAAIPLEIDQRRLSGNVQQPLRSSAAFCAAECKRRSWCRPIGCRFASPYELIERAMKSTVIKRSVAIAGHKTSVKSRGGLLAGAERDRQRTPADLVGPHHRGRQGATVWQSVIGPSPLPARLLSHAAFRRANGARRHADDRDPPLCPLGGQIKSLRR